MPTWNDQIVATGDFFMLWRYDEDDFKLKRIEYENNTDGDLLITVTEPYFTEITVSPGSGHHNIPTPLRPTFWYEEVCKPDAPCEDVIRGITWSVRGVD